MRNSLMSWRKSTAPCCRRCIDRAQADAARCCLVLANGLHLGRARARLVKHVAQPLARQAPRQLQTDHALSHAQHLRVVGQDGALYREGVVGGHGTHAADLVCRDGDAEARAADEERAVRLASGNELGSTGGNVRIRRLVLSALGADIDNRDDTVVLGEIGLDGVLVADAGVLWERERREAELTDSDLRKAQQEN